MSTRNFTVAFFVAVGVLSCKKNPPADLTKQNIIPNPVSATASEGVFELTKGSSIYTEGESAELKQIGQYLADKINPATGFGLMVSSTRGAPGRGNIYLAVSTTDAPLGDEGYELTISRDLVNVTANKPAGLFRAVQTIRQLLPDRIERSSVQPGPWELASGTIRDYPNYSFRGAMLDVGRHFFGVEDVKRFIDLISFYKMNVLHLHLTDDQGWRIEIKSWPNLTAHGGSSEVGGGKGGFYTQEQFKDIVKYAADRYVTIIPEIDTPGHINAALASYPDLNCNGKAPVLYTGTQVGFSTLCARKDITYKFVDDVVRELAELTPGPYVHIGGDESHATKKEDYIVYVNKAQEIVHAHGKQMIGWDEISQSTIKPNTIAQFWSNVAFAKAAVAQGAKIIMSPAKKTYVDMKYDSTTKLGQAWAAYIELEGAYSWDPATYAEGIGKENILGIESPLWTETITTMDEIEYMVFPRMVGYAEIGWSPAAGRSWDEYKVRLGNHAGRLKALDIDYYRSKLVPWADRSDSGGGNPPASR